MKREELATPFKSLLPLSARLSTRLLNKSVRAKPEGVILMQVSELLVPMQDSCSRHVSIARILPKTETSRHWYCVYLLLHQ